MTVEDVESLPSFMGGFRLREVVPEQAAAIAAKAEHGAETAAELARWILIVSVALFGYMSPVFFIDLPKIILAFLKTGKIDKALSGLPVSVSNLIAGVIQAVVGGASFAWGTRSSGPAKWVGQLFGAWMLGRGVKLIIFAFTSAV